MFPLPEPSILAPDAHPLGGAHPEPPSRTGGFWVSTAQRMGIWGENGWLWQGEHLPWPLLDLVWGEEDAGLRLWLASFGQGVYCVGTNGEAQHFTTTNGLASNYARHLLVVVKCWA